MSQSSLKSNFNFLFLILLLPVLSLLNISFGSVSINFSDILNVFTKTNTGNEISIIIMDYRLPRVLTAIAVGSGLSVAGLLLQIVFRNPLAGPSVLGISAGASLGVALVVLTGSSLGLDILNNSFFLSDASMVIAAFAGALTVLAIITYVSQKIGNIVTILIIGLMLGYLVSAVVGILQFFSGSDDLQAYVIWGLGSFSKNTLARSFGLLVTTLLLIIPLFFLSKPLNAILLGDDYAKNTGFNIKKYNLVFIFLSGILIALGTAFTGPIAFLGLASPHIARIWFQTSDNSKLIPASLLIGSNLALLCNLAASLPGLDTSLPVNAVTSLIGAPIVIWVIVKRTKIKAA